MKWIGQSITDFIARFRSDVYLESIADHGSDPDRFLTMNSTTGKVTYRTGTEVFSDIGAASGDITGVTAGTNLTGGGASGAVTINLANASTSALGAASFASADFGVSSGAVSLGDDVVKDVDTDSGAVTPSVHTITIAGGEGIDTSGADEVVTIAAELATTSNKGVASFASADFAVSSGAVSLTDLTVSHLATATLITESDSIAGNDNDTTLPTSAAVKLYADRPSQQIVLMRTGFKDDLGTTKHYVPLQSELEQTLYQHEMNGFVAPYNGKLLKLMYRGSGNYSGGTVTFTLEQIDRNEAFLTTPDVLETIAVTGPTNNTTDPNMVTANFVGGSGTNAFVAGDHILIGMQFDTDVTSSGSKHFITLVFEFDFSGVAQ